ncbi:MAG: hypothetical protein HOI29_05265 [Planctomycetes bacterium]|nr:hypothetical protein [Planctomycetota bacterium]MBT6452872.1 hypothetical protein [Planctomycetota bacterium]MBT6541594.1 hypothetical protein [Planctomycetota bacterium]MBT6783428.1 hypothetical protein [Planctomycetota bacterium]MBT6967513.1 hypothetical protein [Planctomycetota bacterium]
MADLQEDSSSHNVHPLPIAGSRARSLVRLQLLQGAFTGVLQILRIPLFLLQRKSISSRISRIVKDQAKKRDRSDSQPPS